MASKQESDSYEDTYNNTNKTIDKKKKLISGKCTKPDEADIKRVVKFPHERLDARHKTNTGRNFDKLPFNLLVAGELEIAGSVESSNDERIARINIAKTICYHKVYLKDEDLRNGCDQLIKTIKQGKEE